MLCKCTDDSSGDCRATAQPTCDRYRRGYSQPQVRDRLEPKLLQGVAHRGLQGVGRVITGGGSAKAMAQLQIDSVNGHTMALWGVLHKRTSANLSYRYGKSRPSVDDRVFAKQYRFPGSVGCGQALSKKKRGDCIMIAYPRTAVKARPGPPCLSLFRRRVWNSVRES